MATRTPETWASYRASIGDRSGLFRAIRDRWSVETALYPGCYLDLAPSTAIATVGYLDLDRRAARYFGDPELVAADLAAHGVDPSTREVQFLHGDYTADPPLPEGAFDLLISLFAGLVGVHCRRFLRPGGLLLANTSHGDASLAALDPGWELVAAVHHRGGRYRLDERELDSYLVPTRPGAADPERIAATGRGIAYTRPAFGYLFRAV